MKLGIVGAGLIVHTLLEFVEQLPIELTAICATQKEIDKLNDLKARYSFSCVYTDYEEMLQNDEIDTIYERAIKAGALGGKLLGAGGGGFTLFYVPKQFQKAVKEELSDLLLVPFRFEGEGTSVIYYVPESFTPEEER